MCIYVYLFSFNIFNISPFKKITSFTGFVLFISISLCFFFLTFFSSSTSSSQLISLWGLFLLFLTSFFPTKNHSSNIQIFKFLIYLLYFIILLYFLLFVTQEN